MKKCTTRSPDEVGRQHPYDPNMSINMATNIDDRPFTIRRVAKVRSSITIAPMVVSCTWTELNLENVYRYVCKAEDLVTITGCVTHTDVPCKGHHMMDPNNTAWMIPFGFATGDELRYSDAAAMNNSICSGDKTAEDIAEYCFNRIKGKKGILRKQCNSTRPTNTMRCVESPMWPNRDLPMSEQIGCVTLPTEFFDKGEFLFMNEDGRFEKAKMVEGDVVAYGRCPSQGVDSALPMMVKRAAEGETSMRVPLDVCKMNNTDFDGDEAWMYKPGSPDAVTELNSAWKRLWVDEGREGVCSKMFRLVQEAGGDPDVDPAMYTTMPLEDMINHPGGEMYNTLMLKPHSWNVMGRTTFEQKYWRTWVRRSMDGIINSTMGKHGIGEPYMQMRNAMMMGTIVHRDRRFVRVRSSVPQPIPAVIATGSMGFGDCSSAMTKMTASLYQREIDMAKHGKTADKVTAVETLMKATDVCFAFVNSGGPPVVKMMPVMSAMSSSLPYTKLSYVAKAESPVDLLERAMMVTCMVEDLDRISLTNEERLAMAVFVAFVSRCTTEIISDRPVPIMRSLRTDWYTSATCTNISWIKEELRKTTTDNSINMATDINSLLGSMAIGNMCRFAPLAPYKGQFTIG